METGKPVKQETIFKPSDFLVKTPVTDQTGPVNRSNRSEPVTHVLFVAGFWGTHSRVAERTRLIPEEKYLGKC